MARDIDEVIGRVRSLFPDAKVEQLRVAHPGADDDGLWFFGFEGVRQHVQLESSTGMAPFIIEHDDMPQSEDSIHGADVDRALAEVASYLARLKGRANQSIQHNALDHR